MLAVDYSRKFLKSASRLPTRIVQAVTEKEALFKTTPFHPSLETHKLHGKDKDAWAFSITRKYRIKFLFLSPNRALFIDISTHDLYQ